MERFQFYGDLEKIVQGNGKLFLKDENELKVSFEIAKRGEEKLLFNLISSDNTDPLNLFSLMKSEQFDRIEGNDDKGRKVIVTDLLVKDSTSGTKTDSKVFVNGYAGQCRIGKKEIKEGYTANFDLFNFLFHGNQSKIEENKNGEKITRSILQLDFSDFHCRIEQTKDYSITKQLLKRQGGVLKTSTLSTKVSNQTDYDSTFEKVRKLCQLLSVARSTFINWGSCRVINTDGKVVYELHGNAQSRYFHETNLIKDLPGDTESFLKSAWLAYDKYEKVFDLRRFLYGYADTFMNSYIETRCLNIAALTESISSRWAISEGRDRFLDEKVFRKQLPKLKKGVKAILEIVFDKIKESYVYVMLSKIKGFNRRPLDWKLKRLRKEFDCPVTDDEIKRFVYNRDSLAHSSLFPEDEDNTESFLFMRHFLDRIVISVLGYSGNYFDMEIREEKSLLDN
ncbi:hypothetical protein SAMN05443144_12083 [Fodinibius roseus]|uniref:ApeA N-terminal domain-containing protein n=1 Tax=Fodinibius roseus TaxID=1194090 RepID=A0A1M5HM21_9BACT|nr:hypothetical protein [Fodinibius roseus]SHG16961.1 hypothetical protein SAMN05443144_12083 [Fodinibius roseus]